jgi:hypothetical protein
LHPFSKDAAIAALEITRTNTIAAINTIFDSKIAELRQDGPAIPMVFKMPTPVDGADPRNKNGHNLTPRGVEILYRVFDDGGGYNRASKMLNITQAAAKNRKGNWNKLGGLNRTKAVLDIDTV